MRNSAKRIYAATFGLAAGAILAVPAHAGFSWTLDSSPNQGSCQAAAVGNSCQQSSMDAGTTIVMTASGWASSASNNTGSNLEQATLRRYDGLAVNAQGEANTSPDHATDNDGKLESILYSFTSGGSPIDVIIDSVTQGWHKDADFTLLAYTGAAPAFNGNLSGRSYDDLTSNGWSLVSNNYYSQYNSSTGTDITASDNAATNDYNTSDLNSGNVSSSYWLVAAVNTAFVPSGYVGNDFIKVKTLTGSVKPGGGGGQVPEPSTLALLFAASASMLFARRRRDAV